MNEIVPGIFQWRWFAANFGYDFNGHFVAHPDGNLAIDPVELGDDGLAELAARGVARIVLTNRNHFRDAARLQARTGARVAVHAADAAFVVAKGVPVHDALVAGQEVGPFTILAADGKSPGEVALHWPARRLLVVGDACVGNPPGHCALLPERVMDDPAQLRRSLHRLAHEVDFDTLLVGDGVCILTGAAAALRALTATFADTSANTPG